MEATLQPHLRLQRRKRTGYTYDLAGLLRAETHLTGDLAGHTLTRGYDTARLASLQLAGPSGQLHAVGYDYRDSAGRDLGRLAAVTTGDLRVAYAYTPQSPLPATTTWTRSGTLRQTTTHTWDKLNRLTEQRTTSGPLQRGAAYAHNLANQRTRATLPDGEYWDYEYDALGQIKSGEKRLPSAENVPGYSFDYTFDDIGNRRTTVTNGRAADYVTNNVNAYQTRQVPRVVDLLGEAPAAATVTVNDVPALLTTKTDPALNYFYSPYPAQETGRHLFTLGSRVAGPPEALYDEQRVAYLPPPIEAFVHDADGNLTDDWRWRYTWDAENRLVQMDTQPAAILSGVPHQRILYRYDSQGRRVRQTVSAWDQSAETYTVVTDLRYLYDGWNLLAELDTTGAIVRRHTWGRDLSGSLQGAGGVGGLVITEIEGAALLPAYDGNGNLLSLVNAANGTLVADYEYDPFGTTLKAVGLHAQTNPWRFSTKYTDNATGLVYYGFRYYNPSTGRWLSRDPIGEAGGVNLYGMIKNDALNEVDHLGLSPASVFGGCLLSSLKSTISRKATAIIRDSSICVAAAQNHVNASDLESGSNCGWKTTFDGKFGSQLFDKRGFISDTSDCIMKAVGGAVVDEHVKSEIVKKVLHETIGNQDLSGYLARVSQQIESGSKLRYASKCNGEKGGLLVIPFFETNVVDRAAGFTGQILIPLRRISCNLNGGGKQSRGLGAQVALTCCGCKTCGPNDVPSYYRRSLAADADDFNRFPPVDPYLP